MYSADLGCFYRDEPQEICAAQKSWFLRSQNILLGYTEAVTGAILTRAGQPDEYAVLLPDADTVVTVTAGNETLTVHGGSLIFVPPGGSRIEVLAGGRIVRLFTTKASDLSAICANREAYQTEHAGVAPVDPWPQPTDGWRIRAYDLAVAPAPGRFGRIWRCSTIMINVFEPQLGARDVTKLSPHHHDDFEQCSLALDGSFTHHLRWPWTPDMTSWREDEHIAVGSPSAIMIPPPVIHTSMATAVGTNMLVDIFSPPRRDFSAQPGWILNADDYPLP